MIVRTLPLLYSAAASFATSGHAKWLWTLAWMPSRCSLAAISSSPKENMFSKPRIR